MKSKDAAEIKGRREDANLDCRYGKIGIPALAAALPYRGEARNQNVDAAPVDAAPPVREERWLSERAAA